MPAGRRSRASLIPYPGSSTWIPRHTVKPCKDRRIEHATPKFRDRRTIMKPKLTLTIMVLTLGLLLATGALAQTLVPPAAFDVTGFIQEATLDGTVGGLAGAPLANTDPRAGGTLTVN